MGTKEYLIKRRDLSAAPMSYKDKELFGSRNEGVILNADTPREALDLFNSTQLPGNRYNLSYLSATEVL